MRSEAFLFMNRAMLSWFSPSLPLPVSTPLDPLGSHVLSSDPGSLEGGCVISNIFSRDHCVSSSSSSAVARSLCFVPFVKREDGFDSDDSAVASEDRRSVG